MTGMLDVDDAVQALVDEARAITDARYGVLVTFGRRRTPRRRGDVRDESRRARTSVGAPRVSSSLPTCGTSRVRFESKTSSATPRHSAFPPTRCLRRASWGMPLRHLGKQIGLGVSGRQARRRGVHAGQRTYSRHVRVPRGRVLTNARSYRDEQRAKAELEALINDSPLGVLVFDARTGNLLTVNEETRRNRRRHARARPLAGGTCSA